MYQYTVSVLFQDATYNCRRLSLFLILLLLTFGASETSFQSSIFLYKLYVLVNLEV